MKKSGHSDYGNFQLFLEHLPLLRGFQQILHQLLVLRSLAVWNMISMTFAAVIWDADDPCSANTTWDPESSFTISPRSTTRPLYFWFVSNSAFFKWQSINEATWTFAHFVLASSITSDLLLTLVRSHAGIVSSFSHSFSTAAFAAGIFIAWGIGINLCTKL